MFPGNLCCGTLSVPGQNDVIALLSLLLTLNIANLPVFLLLTLNIYLFSGFNLFSFQLFLG